MAPPHPGLLPWPSSMGCVCSQQRFVCGGAGSLVENGVHMAAPHDAGSGQLELQRPVGEGGPHPRFCRCARSSRCPVRHAETVRKKGALPGWARLSAAQ
jgi:hypothetical protein